jgi:hypothetical protein
VPKTLTLRFFRNFSLLYQDAQQQQHRELRAAHSQELQIQQVRF